MTATSEFRECAEAVRNFRPLRDMILVKPDNAPDMVGSIVVPQGALPQGQQPGDYRDTFMGTVVAVGPGDRHIPFESLKCRACGKKRTYDCVMDTFRCACPEEPFQFSRMRHNPKTNCYERFPVREFNVGRVDWREIVAWNAGHYPMYTKVGDRVAFPRRPSSPNGIDPETGNCDIYIDGMGYLLFHEEQNCLAIIEE